MESNENKKNSKLISFLAYPRQALIGSFAGDREFSLMLAAAFVAGIASGINTSIFSNFLNDVYHLSEVQRGIVEFPRELPGALMILIFAALSFLGSTCLAALSMALASLGMLGLGFFSPGFSVMLAWMVVLNLGTHIFMPLVPGIGMELSQRENYGIRLARINAYSLAATIIGYFIVWLGFEYLVMSYAAAFTAAAIFYFAAAVLLTNMRPMQIQRRRFIVRKKYMLFYALSVVNGARKQIFLTFAPWVLISIYGVDAPTFALYGFIVAAVSIGTRTIVGRAIDTLGERFVLSVEAVHM